MHCLLKLALIQSFYLSCFQLSWLIFKNACGITLFAEDIKTVIKAQLFRAILTTLKS